MEHTDKDKADMIGRRIPVVAGVTGHRDLREEDLPLLKEAVRAELRKIKEQCPHSPLLLLSSLAEGADQICARTALEEGWDISAALPMPLEEYEKDFQGRALEELRALCASAREVFTAPETEPRREGRDYCYRQAGIYVAEHCHVLLALWDGAPAKADGCGTAETVEFRLRRTYLTSSESGLQRPDGSVIRISAQRRSGASAAGSGRPPEVTWYGEEEACGEILRKTDSFNKDCLEHDGSGDSGIPVSREDPVTKRLNAVYAAADGISVRNAAIHRRTVAALSVTATLLTMAFLLYDEVYLSWMIMVSIFMLAALFAINLIANRLRSHRKYLEYRILAEGLRVQIYLRGAGMRDETARMMPWSLQRSTPWVRTALAVLSGGEEPPAKQSVRELWIEDQKGYHEKALEKNLAQGRSNDRIVRTALAFMIMTYAATLVFELIWGGMFSGDVRLAPEQLDFCRMILKVLMGTLSAATLFAGNYYGRLSLDESAADHRRMIELYDLALQRIQREGETEKLLEQLAREELGENSSWYAYQSMNRPQVSL